MGKPAPMNINLSGSDISRFNAVHGILNSEGVTYSRPQVIALLISHWFKTNSDDDKIQKEFRRLEEEIAQANGRPRR